MPTYDAICPSCKEHSEIRKPMRASMPCCPTCNTRLDRVYQALAIVYNAPDFDATETRLDKQVGPERAARFRAQRSDAEARAKAGRLTPYERALEAIE